MPWILAVTMGCMLCLTGCSRSGDDDVADDGGNGTPVTAFNFNQDNTVTAAKLAADTMTFFPAFSKIGHTIISELAYYDLNNPPFDLMLCTNTGSSMLSWTDTDSSGTLSAGDTTSLALTNCDIGGIATGTINFTISSADLDGLLPDSIVFSAAVNLSIYDDPDTTVFTANFDANLSTSDNNVFTIAYTADDASGQKITVSENNIQLYQFGCFNVTHQYSPSNFDTYSLSPNGVINAASKIMSLVGGPHPQLTFTNDDIETGTKRLLSIAAGSGCASIGVANGVGDSDGTYLDIEALGGGYGYVRLHTYNADNVEFFTVDTTWDALLIIQ